MRLEQVDGRSGTIGGVIVGIQRLRTAGPIFDLGENCTGIRLGLDDNRLGNKLRPRSSGAGQQNAEENTRKQILSQHDLQQFILNIMSRIAPRGENPA